MDIGLSAARNLLWHGHHADAVWRGDVTPQIFVELMFVDLSGMTILIQHRTQAATAERWFQLDRETDAVAVQRQNASRSPR